MDHLTDAPVANILILAGIIFLAVGLFGRIGGFIGSIFGNIEAGKNSRVLAGVLGVLLIVGGAWLHEGVHKPAASTPSPAAPVQVASPAATTPSAGTATASPTTAAPPEVPREAPGTKARATTPVKTIKPVTPEDSTASALGNKSPASVPPASGEDSLVGTSLVGTWTNPIPSANSISRIEVTRDEVGLHAHIWDTCTAGECDMGTHRLRPSGTTATYGYAVGPRRRMGSLNPYAPGVTLLSVDILEPGTEHRWHYNFVLLKSTASDNVRDAFARYVSAPSQKALAMAPGGAINYQYKSASTKNATQSALKRCVERGKPGCRIILVNNDATE
jgi:hypothetical protein